jgi:hypothetical protein
MRAAALVTVLTRTSLTAVLSCAIAVRCLTAQTDSLPRSAIAGVVLDSVGQPGRHAIVQLIASAVARPIGFPGLVRRSGKLVGYTYADTDGRFRFDSLPPSRYAIVANAATTEGARDSLLVGARDTLSVEIRVKLRRHVMAPDTLRGLLLDRLAEARARWATRRPTRYRLTAKMQCFCFGSMNRGVTSEYRNDSLVGTVGRFGRLHRAADRGGSSSVPALFALVEWSIRDLDTAVTRLEFHPVYGVPTVFETDGLEGLLDAWFHQYVTGFREIR